MKMLSAQYTIMAAALDHIRPAIDEAAPLYRAAGHSDKRFRWDCFRAAKIEGNSTAWQYRVLYPYLNDSHCDTALRHYFAGQFGGAS